MRTQLALVEKAVAEVLREHEYDVFTGACKCKVHVFDTTEWNIHVAPKVAARVAEVLGE